MGDEIIALGHAQALAQVEDVGAQEEALRLTLLHRWGVRELEDHLAGPADPDGTPATPRRSAPAGRKSSVCTVCRTEHQGGGIQTVNLCDDCLPKLTALGDGQAAGTYGSMTELLGDARVALKEAEQLLAQSPSDAPLAERISAVMERIQVAMGGET